MFARFVINLVKVTWLTLWVWSGEPVANANTVPLLHSSSSEWWPRLIICQYANGLIKLTGSGLTMQSMRLNTSIWTGTCSANLQYSAFFQSASRFQHFLIFLALAAHSCTVTPCDAIPALESGQVWSPDVSGLPRRCLPVAPCETEQLSSAERPCGLCALWLPSLGCLV